jgi:hypothetical protein
LENRISSTELRLGLTSNWKINYFTANKFYTDSTKIILFIIYFVNGLQKQLNYTIPQSFIKIFISNHYFFINFIYILNKKKKKINLEATRPSFESELQKMILTGETYSDLAERYLSKYYKANNKKIKIINKTKQKNKKKFKNLKLKLIFLILKTLNIKIFEENLNELFYTLMHKKSYVTSLNISQILSKSPKALFKNFYDIRHWYRKFGGNTYKIKQKLLTTYYALTYKNCLPLYLNMIKNNVEHYLTKQRIMMTTSYNILFAYTWVQRNLEGLKITFKGTIGNHGRAKSMTFMLGSLYQSSLIKPIEYYYIKIDTKFGSISMKLWCIFYIPLE